MSAAVAASQKWPSTREFAFTVGDLWRPPMTHLLCLSRVTRVLLVSNEAPIGLDLITTLRGKTPVGGAQDRERPQYDVVDVERR